MLWLHNELMPKEHVQLKDLETGYEKEDSGSPPKVVLDRGRAL